LALVAKQIDEALGGEYFTGIDLPRILNLKAQMRWRRVGRRWNTMIKAKRASSSMPGLGNGERGSGCGALN
jgi:hypothetical protein